MSRGAAPIARERRGGRSAAPFVVLLALLLAPTATGQSALVFDGRSVQEVVREVERVTDWRFLYRDALVAGRRVTLATSPDRVITDLADALRPLGLALSTDERRRQVLIVPAPAGRKADRGVRGRIVDEASGAPLPYATVTWVESGELRGVVSDAGGLFELAPGADDGPTIITASYLGYRPRVVSVPTDGSAPEVAIGLQERPVIGSEVLVSASMLTSELDTSWHHLLRSGVIAPLGETGIMRSLQGLPAVSVTPAMSDGLTVRGSRADGFQVLLDGMPIYSQSHLFGLFDAFNEDALRTVGLFYGVAPASYQAPPGGTVSMVTRSGSAHRVAGSVGLGGTAFSGTIEGPLPNGSWLLSARRSYLSSIDWMGSSDLVAVGLDLGRETGPFPSGTLAPGDELRLVGDPYAEYHDGHLRVDLDARGGARFTASGYLGGDKAQYDAVRPVPMPGRGHGASPLRLVDAGTASRWGTGSGSVQARIPTSSGISASLVGVTRYHSSYRKEDYLYAGRDWAGPAADPMNPGNGPGFDQAGMRRIAPLSNYSNLSQWRLAQEWSAVTGTDLVWSVGSTLDVYTMRLEEESLGRSGFVLDRSDGQMDVFGSVGTARGRRVGGDLGLRAHVFGPDLQLGLSPRVSLRIAEGGPVSFAAGYSRNHQFLHRISIENQGYADLWVLSAPGERPTRVDYFTITMVARPFPSITAQVEAYHKDYRDLRVHETVAEARGFVLGSLLLRPWLNDAAGTAQGLELMVRHRIGPALASHGYAWSSTKLSHPQVLGGLPFPAPWDRRHQYTLNLQAEFAAQWSASAAWMIASGMPNALKHGDPDEPGRLPTYHRLDLSLEFRPRRLEGALSIRGGLFNAYDRKNTWYRTPVPVVIESARTGAAVQTVAVDVYDLGMQPSFEIRYRF